LVHQAGAALGSRGPKRSGARNGAGRPTRSYLCLRNTVNTFTTG
jgi:hypothetical protein